MTRCQFSSVEAVHKDVKPPELFDSGCDRMFERCAVAYVNAYERHPQLLRNGLTSHIVNVGDHDFRTLFHEAPHDRLANAGAASGDEHCLTVQITHWCPSRFPSFARLDVLRRQATPCPPSKTRIPA